MHGVKHLDDNGIFPFCIRPLLRNDNLSQTALYSLVVSDQLASFLGISVLEKTLEVI